MSFISGSILIDAPASALNNSGEKISGTRLQENTVATKYIRNRENETYPYVSAQALRYWLRATLENTDPEWKYLSPHRENKVSYTDGNPISWWDDDLLGYMRASGDKKQEDEAQKKGFTPREVNADKKLVTITRAAPFRASTLVSLAPVQLTNDFGAMTRHEGDPVPYEHQFYKAILQGLFSLDLGMAGKFYYRRRTGFQNLDEVRRQLAEKQGLTHIEDEQAYQLSLPERLKRVKSLMTAMGQLQGGAKQAVHYTDVSPAVVVCAITTGGNHPFNYIFSSKRERVSFESDVFMQTITNAKKHNQLLSPVFVGWKPGFLPEEFAAMNKLGNQDVKVADPVSALSNLNQWLEDNSEIWDK